MNTIYALLPLLIIVAASLLVMILEVFLKRDDRSYLAYLSLLFLIGSAAACVKFWNKGYSYFDGNLSLSNLSLFFTLILIVSTFLVILISIKYLTLQDTNYGEYYALLLSMWICHQLPGCESRPTDQHAYSRKDAGRRLYLLPL